MGRRLGGKERTLAQWRRIEGLGLEPDTVIARRLRIRCTNTVTAARRRLGIPAYFAGRAFAEWLLERIGAEPLRYSELMAVSNDDYGGIKPEKMFRALRWLLESGRIVRVGAKRSHRGGYVRRG